MKISFNEFVIIHFHSLILIPAPLLKSDLLLESARLATFYQIKEPPVDMWKHPNNKQSVVLQRSESNPEISSTKTADEIDFKKAGGIDILNGTNKLGREPNKLGQKSDES